MTGIFFCKSFANKNMPQMCATFRAGYFSPASIGVGGPFYGSFNFVVKAWPAATSVKFIG